MKKLLVLIAIAGGIYYFQPQLFTALLQGKGAFDANGNAEIIVFGFDGCGKYCDDASKLIKKTRIPFQDVTVGDNNSEEYKLLKSYGLSTNSMPAIIIGDQRFQGYYPQRLKSALAEHYGPSVLSGPERRAMKSHFNADGSAKFVFYGTSWCGYCKKLRNHLNDNNVIFTEIDVEKNATGKAYYDILKGTGYPLAYIGYRRVGGANISAIDKDIAELM